jgi:hypothetical protein
VHTRIINQIRIDVYLCAFNVVFGDDDDGEDRMK